jgi:hypothetical protein
MEDAPKMTTGLLSRNASFRLIVRGSIDVKDIEPPIMNLALDKKVLTGGTSDFERE